MKNSSIVSAVIGGAFFAVPYLALSVGILPSLAIGAAAYGAGELLFKEKDKKNLKENNRSLYDTLQDAKGQNKQISEMTSKVDNQELRKNIKEIVQTVTKIINTVEGKPEKAKKMNNFFYYYLPTTLRILERYDEIENQQLSTEEGQKFMKQTENMIKEINQSFKTQLSNLYQADIVDTDAEMKVFKSMLKSEGYDSESDFKHKEKEE